MVKNKNNKAIWGSRTKKDASKLFEKLEKDLKLFN